MKFLIMALVTFCTLELFPQKVGDAYALDINNIYLPLNSKGILADVNVPPLGTGGQFGGNVFLFSGGFFLSGYSNGTLWANAVASASLVEDYLPGTVANPNNPDAQLYKIRSDDPPFGLSWQHWQDAVALGADFYDGDGDGIYNPADLNGNNQWDENEDHPDLLGDETIWCVYHDAAAGSRWSTVEPIGIEIRQTVFAYSSQGPIMNTIFIRYRIKYVGLGNPIEPDTLNDVYFSIWDDPDLGDSQDDLVGCDTVRNGGFVYNDGDDSLYGNNPPCFLENKLAGLRVYIPGETYIDINGNGLYDEGIDTSIDTAFVHRGQLLGITAYPGAKSQPLSSSIHYLNGNPEIGDPNSKEEARNYMLGLTRSGDTVDPCTWTYGEVRGGVDCAAVDPKFWYSGDPVQDVGWVNITAGDQRQMQSFGPFELVKGEEQEVFIAYSVGQGGNALTSIDEGRSVWVFAYWLHLINFNPVILSIDDKATDIPPSEFTLHQNYPNPFNPSTLISWQVPVGSHQTLKIYDVLGNEVATLVDEYKPAGTYEVEFNSHSDAGRNLTSGIYFYQLLVSALQSKDGKTEGFVETKKMILLK